MRLAKSEPGSRISKRQNGPRAGFPGDCFGGGSSNCEGWFPHLAILHRKAYPVSIVRAAYLEVANLAKYAQSSTNGDIWNVYFNAPGQQSAVYNVYQDALNYRAQGVGKLEL